MIFHLNKQAGFSLVETLVAISILLLVIVGPMTISSRTAKSATFASEQVQAFFLAQEGVELVQKARDDLQLDFFKDSVANPTPWADFISTSTTPLGAYKDCFININSKGCGLEWGSTAGKLATPVSCSTVTNCLLRKDVAGNRSHFTYSAGTPTLFTRQIKLEYTGAGSVKVVSEVTWRTGSLVANQRVVVDTYLYNVYGN